ncbi:MAG: hypothetical protein GX950_02340 [Candidatus Diapherotrites archaeon]|jgi:hypothetical protein|uniref:Lipoprotein n=1 Tax=Candidatus Iainarchaeum sp. TaxID=3101447 RepID=A0A7K4BZH8_9ARCH|nr:hypothetical protein [Candidatus Diapherotrites archaeon]
MKKFTIFSLILLIFTLFGCINLTNDVQKINQLQEKYGMTTAFVPNEKILLDYTNELIELNLPSTLADAELYSAQSFYQVLSLTRQLNSIDMLKENCKSIAVINAYQTTIVCENISQKALEKLNALNSNELQQLRSGQKETVQDYLNTCTTTKIEMRNICSTLN